MKEDRDLNNERRRLWKILINYYYHHLPTNYKLTTYLIILILTYTIGYFSSPTHSTTSTSISSPNPNPSQIIPPPPSPTTPITIPAPIKTTCPTVVATDHNRFGPTCGAPVGLDRVRQIILDRIYYGTSPYENFPPRHMAHLLREKRVKGWGSYGPVFENLIKKVRPKTIVEVGTFLGASAIHMAQITRELGLDTQILCLDDFRGWAGFRGTFKFVRVQNGDVVLLSQFMQNVIYYNLTGSILPVPFSTGSGLQKLCELGVFADLVEVDAGHDFHSAWADINRAHKLLRPGGVLFGHDYFLGYDNKGVRRAVDLFARLNGFKIRVDGQHWVLDTS